LILSCFVHVKTGPTISDLQLNLARGDSQAYRECADAAVFHGIVHGFLCDSKQRKGNISGHIVRNILIGEVDLHRILLGELVAEAPQGGYEPKILQL
jgi:hypothetical protein